LRAQSVNHAETSTYDNLAKSSPEPWPVSCVSFAPGSMKPARQRQGAAEIDQIQAALLVLKRSATPMNLLAGIATVLRTAIEIAATGKPWAEVIVPRTVARASDRSLSRACCLKYSHSSLDFTTLSDLAMFTAAL